MVGFKGKSIQFLDGFVPCGSRTDTVDVQDILDHKVCDVNLLRDMVGTNVGPQKELSIQSSYICVSS